MTDATLPSTIVRLVEQREIRALRDELVLLQPHDIASLINEIPEADRVIIFRILPRELASDVFAELESDMQEALITELGDERVAKILEEMSADDRTAFFEELPAAAVRTLLQLLPRDERRIAAELLGYPESSVGRLMSTDYLTVKEGWSMQEVIDYVRREGSDSDSLNVLYVVDERGRLIDDIRMREVLLAPVSSTVRDLMNHRFNSLHAFDDQEVAVEAFKKYGRTMLPVVDSQGSMLGIVTIDDVLEIAEEEATEDIHKLAAVEALDTSYIRTPVLELVQKRASWLVLLFFGQMLTASSMSVFQDEIARAVVLALFVPLIISSGGNSGSQAAMLIIRALALGELTLRDWKRVFMRELTAGLLLGTILGVLGFLRVVVWNEFFGVYEPYWIHLGYTIAFSLVGVVLWGTLAGGMLPFILKALKLDPATSSAPFVATLVDVTGLVIYFTVASLLLSGLIL